MGRNKCKYPKITVKLTGKDGNAFSIMGAVRRALIANDVDTSEVNAFLAEAMAGDYDALLQTCMRWVNVE